jgi:hypothetical protein
MTNLDEILLQCQHSDKTTRETGERNIDQLAMHNFGDLIQKLGVYLAEETNPTKSRQLAATIVKNLILHTPQHKGVWEALDPNIRESVKNSSLGSLGSGKKEIQKAAALVVAGKN